MGTLTTYNNKDFKVEYGYTQAHIGYIKVTVGSDVATLRYEVTEFKKIYKVSTVGTPSWYDSLGIKLLELTTTVMKFVGDAELYQKKSAEQLARIIYDTILGAVIKEELCTVEIICIEKSPQIAVVISKSGSVEVFIEDITATIVAVIRKDTPDSFRALLQRTIRDLDEKSYNDALNVTNTAGYAYLESYSSMEFIKKLVELHSAHPMIVRH